MKRLLLNLRQNRHFLYCLILIGILCTSPNVQKAGIQTIMKPEIDSLKTVCDSDVLITLKLLIEYEKFCYNDSTEIDVYVDPNVKTEVAPGIYSTTLMMGHFEKKWVHRQPTVADFVQWVRKKYSL